MKSRKDLDVELFDFCFSLHRVQDLHAFHSLGYFHTSFVSRYSSLLHTTVSVPAGQHPWLPLRGPFRANDQSRQGKTTRSASTSHTPDIHHRCPYSPHLPFTASGHCITHSTIPSSDALASCAFTARQVHSKDQELTSNPTRLYRPVFANTSNHPRLVNSTKKSSTRLPSGQLININFNPASDCSRHVLKPVRHSLLANSSCKSVLI
jgi:hypothetical protein